MRGINDTTKRGGGGGHLQKMKVRSACFDGDDIERGRRGIMGLN